MKRSFIASMVGLLALSLSACSTTPSPSPTTSPQTSPAPTASPTASPSPQAGYKLLKEHPHDVTAYTQGLEVVEDGKLLESTGLEGHSQVSIHAVGAKTEGVKLPAHVFGEGITQVGDEYWQVTWKNNIGYRYDKNLKQVGTFSYEGEGWGVCHDAVAGVVYRSDGTSTLSLHDDKTFALKSTVQLTTPEGKELRLVNELECVDGYVWANVWTTPYVVKLDGKTGETLQVYDLTNLVEKARKAAGGRLEEEQVLNGLAYDASRDVWYVTGKEWPVLFEVRFS